MASQQNSLLESCGCFDGGGIVSLVLLSNFISLWSNPQLFTVGINCIMIINGVIHPGWSPRIRKKIQAQRFVLVRYRTSFVTSS